MALTKEDVESVLNSLVLPLKDEITNLRKELTGMADSLQMANNKYNEFMKRFKLFEEDKLHLKKENELLKKTVEKLDVKIQQLE